MPWLRHLAHFGARGGLVSGDNKLGGESGKCIKLGPSMLMSIKFSVARYCNEMSSYLLFSIQESLSGVCISFIIST